MPLHPYVCQFVPVYRFMLEQLKEAWENLQKNFEEKSLSRKIFFRRKLGTVHYLLGVRDWCSVGKTHGKRFCPVTKISQKVGVLLVEGMRKFHVPYNYTILTLHQRCNMQ